MLRLKEKLLNVWHDRTNSSMLSINNEPNVLNKGSKTLSVDILRGIKEDQKTKFADRLNHALDLNNIPPKGKGRQVIVAKMFGVSQKGASKWLEGTTYPDLQRIAVIAKRLNVNVEWLAYGTGTINIESIPGPGKTGPRRGRG